MDMKEIGRVKSLMRDLNEPATTMQECDRKRMIILQLGDIGDSYAAYPLLEFLSWDIYSASAITAIGRLRYADCPDEYVTGIIEKLKDKLDKGSPYNSSNIIIALGRIAEEKADSQFITDKILDIIKNNGTADEGLKNRVVNAVKNSRELNAKEFKHPKAAYSSGAKAKKLAR